MHPFLLFEEHLLNTTVTEKENYTCKLFLKVNMLSRNQPANKLVLHSSLHQNQFFPQTKAAITCWWATPKATSTSITWSTYVHGFLLVTAPVSHLFLWWVLQIFLHKTLMCWLTPSCRAAPQQSPLENGKLSALWWWLKTVCKCVCVCIQLKQHALNLTCSCSLWLKHTHDSLYSVMRLYCCCTFT